MEDPSWPCAFVWLLGRLSVVDRAATGYPDGHHAAMGASGGNSNGSEMLVLTRMTNQSIMIGDDVEVTVLAVARDKIRLGITAPRDVPVFRKEVYLSIHGEQASADGDGGDEDAREAAEPALEELKKGQ